MRVGRRYVAERTLGFTESVIREMTRLSDLHGAINLAQGFPDFAAPEEIKDAAVAAIRADVNQYAITWGARALREALAVAYRERYEMRVDPDTMVTVTCGATEAMIASLLAVVDPDDEVIVFEPFYENYGPDATLCGARPVFVPLRPPEFTFDRDELAAAFSSRTKAIVVNTPNNPTGRVFRRDELESIADLCRRQDVLAVTDEIYEHIVYDGAHVPIATLEGMDERTITISGFSKTFSVTGWRVGTIVAPPELTGAIRKVHDFLTVGAPAPLQQACAAALRLGRPYYERLAAEYRARRDRLHAALVAGGFNPRLPEGAYYLLCDIAHLGFADDVAFARWLVEKVRVAGVPGSAFFSRPELGRGLIRFTFCKRADTLDAAAERLANAARVARSA
ncbi:MAG TPA: aminotransferase class I/II-fold pyridoxal phosphate-dependent enzyme [Candidatus Dormibacteraeota bacterium]|jgi:aminotransferase|nr:aminotransferase class I/II-fold pyridoxal phosphate-dependent enzyme [Candidatus Dormibacteraeota bacterium]